MWSTDKKKAYFTAYYLAHSTRPKMTKARADAKAKGLKRYTTGSQCKRGHTSERLVSNGACLQCLDTPEKRAKEKKRMRALYLANVEKFVARAASFAKANPDRIRAYRETTKFKNASSARIRNYKARRRKAEGCHTGKDVAAIRERQNDKCAYCLIDLKSGGHVDHIVSLKKGGSNWPRNLQLTCVACNASKQDKDPEEFSKRFTDLASRF